MGQHRFFFQGKERGRNELLALALEKVTGVDINRKVLSSKNQSLQKKIKAKGSADDFCRWCELQWSIDDSSTEAE